MRFSNKGTDASSLAKRRPTAERCRNGLAADSEESMRNAMRCLARFYAAVRPPSSQFAKSALALHSHSSLARSSSRMNPSFEMPSVSLKEREERTINRQYEEREEDEITTIRSAAALQWQILNCPEYITIVIAAFARHQSLSVLSRAVRCKRSGNFKLKTARNVRREMSCVIGGISGLKLETSLRRYRFSQRPHSPDDDYMVTKRMVGA